MGTIRENLKWKSFSDEQVDNKEETSNEAQLNIFQYRKCFPGQKSAEKYRAKLMRNNPDQLWWHALHVNYVVSCAQL